MDTLPEIDLSYAELMFEITRNCNMACPHCIRGDAQKLRIKKEYIDAVFSQIKDIGTLMITGGEPSLATDLIKYILKSAEHHNVYVSNFWMATNGSIVKKSFLNAITSWVEYCSENDLTGIRVSVDPYHDHINNKWVFEELEEEIKMFTYDNFGVDFSGAPKESVYLISEGRAKENYNSNHHVQYDLMLLEDGRIEGTLYVNAKGFVIVTCDISYDTMDNNKDYTVCHVSEDIKEGLKNWFIKHPDRVEKIEEKEIS